MEQDRKTVRGTVFPTTELAAGLSEGQIAEFVEDDEVHAGQIVRHAALFVAEGLGLQPVHQIDDVEDAPARAAPKERASVGDPEVGLAGAGAADQHDIALVGHEAAGGQIAHQTLVDPRAGEV